MATSTLWRKSAWVGLFGDKFLSESPTQGAWAPSQAISSFALHLRAACDSPEAALSQQERQAVASVCAALEKASRISVRNEEAAIILRDGQEEGGLGRSAREARAIPLALPTHLPQLFARHWEDLSGLAPGEYTLWDHGWHGHAICLVIARDAGLGATGSLTVCNSGAGIHQYHPSSAAFYPTTKYRTAMHLGGIPWHKLCSDATAYLLLAPMVRELHSPDASSTPDGGKHWSLYEAALPHLAPEGAVEAAIQRSEQEGLHGEWETPQRSGMCYLRGAMTAVRYLLHRRHGWKPPAVKRLFAAVRCAYVQHATGDIEGMLHALEGGGGGGGSGGGGGGGSGGGGSSVGAGAAAAHATVLSAADILGQDELKFGGAVDAFTTSDAAMVALGARQAARALAKLLAQGHCPSASAWPLRHGLPAVDALYAALGRLEVRLFGAAITAVQGLCLPQPATPSQRAVLPLEPRDAALPEASLAWRGFSLLARLGQDTSMFEGAEVEDPRLHKKPTNVLPLLAATPASGSSSSSSSGLDLHSLAPLKPVLSLEDVADVLAHAVGRVEGLCAALALAPATAAYAHNTAKIIALISDAIFVELPMPRGGPAGAPPAAEAPHPPPCPWRQAATLTLPVQLHALQCLRALAGHFLRAYLSNPSGTNDYDSPSKRSYPDYALRVLVLGTLAVMGDALMRAEPGASATASPLTDALNGALTRGTKTEEGGTPRGAGMTLWTLDAGICLQELLHAAPILDPVLLRVRARLVAYEAAVRAAVGAEAPVPFAFKAEIDPQSMRQCIFACDPTLDLVACMGEGRQQGGLSRHPREGGAEGDLVSPRAYRYRLALYLADPLAAPNFPGAAELLAIRGLWLSYRWAAIPGTDSGRGSCDMLVCDTALSGKLGGLFAPSIRASPDAPPGKIFMDFFVVSESRDYKAFGGRKTALAFRRRMTSPTVNKTTPIRTPRLDTLPVENPGRARVTPLAEARARRTEAALAQGAASHRDADMLRFAMASVSAASALPLLPRSAPFDEEQAGEDDVLLTEAAKEVKQWTYASWLKSEENKGATLERFDSTLSVEDAERLAALISVPQCTLTSLLHFFSAKRASALLCDALAKFLEERFCLPLAFGAPAAPPPHVATIYDVTPSPHSDVDFMCVKALFRALLLPLRLCSMPSTFPHPPTPLPPF